MYVLVSPVNLSAFDGRPTFSNPRCSSLAITRRTWQIDRPDSAARER
jgi:hypothetical protein